MLFSWQSLRILAIPKDGALKSLLLKQNNRPWGNHKMSDKYKSLSLNPLKKSAALFQPTHMLEGEVKLSDPAHYVFTDFKRITPLTIEASATIETANEKMILCGVRLLFVCDDLGTIEGLITADDILGEKPVQYIKEHGGCRQDILVLDVMTHQKHLESIQMSDVLDATVGDIVETIRDTGKHHILVNETINGQEVLRGIYSRTQVSRQIGERIKFNNRANSFAELELALVATI